ncbi:MAG: PKD domain-containing protein [Flavobacteriales bacterium]|nr:PKD domain-containing protein [Flavobacteriales bacterium]MDG1779611.1 PKD domain-containing protein [Flavobacteriales bacterium]
MGKKFTPFEESIKQSLENHEMPYDSARWQQMQVQLGGAGNSAVTGWSAAAIFIGVLALGGSAWYFLNPDSSVLAQRAELTEFAIQKGEFSAIRTKAEHFVKGEGIVDTTIQFEEVIDHAVQPDVVETSPALIASQDNSSTGADELSSGEVENGAVIESVTITSKNHVVAEIPAVGDKPAISIFVDTREACVGSSVEFNLSTDDNTGVYLWNFGDGNFSNDINPSHTFNTPGTYEITLSVTSKDDGVIRTSSIESMIVINPEPDANFDWTIVGNEGEFPEIQFNNRSQRATKSEWILGETASTEINPLNVIQSKGLHVIELTVTNEFGCTDRKARAIAINEDYALMAPQKISPNGDGIFDSFMPRALMDGSMDFELTILDGENKIYTTTQATTPWTGTLPDGTMAELNKEYMWIAIVKDRNGFEKYYSGSFEITP